MLRFLNEVFSHPARQVRPATPGAIEMTQVAEPRLSVFEVYRTCWRHKRKMGLFFLAVMTVTGAITLLMRPTYRSQAKLFIRLGRENVTLDPTATLGQTPIVAVPQSRENDINSVLEILKSRTLIEAVVDAVSPQAILGDADLPSDDLLRWPAEGLGAPNSTPDGAQGSPAPAAVGPRYKAIVALTKALEVDAVKKSNIIQVTYDGPSPELARAVVTRLVEFYLEQHLRLHRTSGAQQFLAEQAERLRDRLARAEEGLRDLKNETGLAAPVEQRQVLVIRIGRLQDELLQTAGALAAAEAEVRLLREKLAALPRTQVTAQTTGMRNEAADLMRSQLYTLELRELEVLAKYPAGSPEVRMAREQSAAAREILDRQERTREQLTTGPSRVYEDTQLALLKQEPVLASLKARSEALRAQLEQERASLKALNEDSLRLARLQRDAEIYDSDYRKYVANLEQAHIERAMEAEKIFNISIVQPATCDVKPIRPNKLLNLGVGLFVALFGSVGLALAWERLGQSLKRATETGRGPSAPLPVGG